MTKPKDPKPAPKPSPPERKHGFTKKEVEHTVVYGQQGLGKKSAPVPCACCGNLKADVCAVCGN